MPHAYEIGRISLTYSEHTPSPIEVSVMDITRQYTFLQILQALVAAIISYIVYDNVVHFNLRRHLARIPRIKSQQAGSDEEKRQEYLRSAKALYKEGYETVGSGMFLNITQADISKFTDQVYRMWNASGMQYIQYYSRNSLTISGQDSIVIPRKFLDELRRLPEDTLSAGKAVADVSAVLERTVNLK